MFRVYKKYIKYKILSSLKDKLLFHCQQETLEIEKAKKRQTDEYKKIYVLLRNNSKKQKKKVSIGFLNKVGFININVIPLKK